MDFGQPISLGAFQLNDAAIGADGVIVGCAVESGDYSQLTVRQFMNPLAKADGVETGGIWLTSRDVVLTGTIYGSTRTDAYNRLASLVAACLPITGQVTGETTLVFRVPKAAGSWTRTLYVRPNGLRHADVRSAAGGNDALPLAIPWSLALLARPGYTDV